MEWAVCFSRKTGNQYEKLRKSGRRPPINDIPKHIQKLVSDKEKTLAIKRSKLAPYYNIGLILIV